MHGPWFDPLVSGSGKIGPRLEGVVADIPKKRACEIASGIYEGGGI
ncbi:uncharacterized protein METZ01_LOCUS9384, partial [marine metagenome]